MYYYPVRYIGGLGGQECPLLNTPPPRHGVSYATISIAHMKAMLRMPETSSISLIFIVILGDCRCVISSRYILSLPTSY